MEADWDLYAVVRSCSSVATSAVSTAPDIFSDFYSDLDANSSFSSQFLSPLCRQPSESRNCVEGLYELYQPFIPKSQSQPIFSSARQISPPSPLSPLSSLSPSAVQTQQKQPPKQAHTAPATAPRAKRRKNQMKKVCQVPAENLSSDIWAWRKYGQKPIKGSPYPRGYYRCSSSKGCLARKQVERNRSDPGMFIVTYTAEHNHPAPTHRNSLAGSTRQKQNAPQPGTPGETKTTAERKPEEEMAEDGDDDDLALSDLVMNDDFFVGFDGIDSPGAGDFFSDEFSSTFGIPHWAITSNAATAAGSG